MSEFRFCVNPSGRELAQCSAVLNGRIGKRDYIVNDYRTTLSIKSVSRGYAIYRTRAGRFRVDADNLLVLNHGQEYSLEIPAGTQTETLCPFFQPGLIEHVAGSRQKTSQQQLDDIDAAAGSIEFCERLYLKEGGLAACLSAIASGLKSPARSGPWLEDRFFRLAEELVRLHDTVRNEISDFPGCRPSTREELYRRLHRARDWIDSSYADAVTVSQAARVACMSPYHFQRMFRLAFRQTPMQFLQERRLRAARRLLSGTDRDITSICLDVGFESLGSFSWLFRRRFGASPRDFRRRQRAF